MEYYNQNEMGSEISQTDQKWLNDDAFRAMQDKLSKNAKRAVLAYRVSTKGQVDHDDIPMQKIECRKYAQQQGWRVVAEKAEKGVSGSKVSAANRDVIQELRSEAEKHTFDVLLVYMFDRLGRIESETPFVLEWFVQHGIEMWSTHEGQQRIESHGDKLMNYIRFWQAAGESEKISMRTRDRIREIASSGHYTGGCVPFGYRIMDKGRVNKRDRAVMDLEIEPDEAILVREIFDRVANAGCSAYALAKEFNSRGIKTHSGTKFQRNHIVRIIRHEGYTGYIITRAAKSDFIPELKIIDDDVFERANKVTDERSREYQDARTVAHTAENPTLLAGMVYCADCGARMSGFLHIDRYKTKSGIKERRVPKYNCFQRAQKLRPCKGQSLYRADIIDGIVLDIAHEVFRTICDAPCDKQLEQKIRQKNVEARRKKAAAERNVADAQERLDGYAAMILDCHLGKCKFSEEMLAGNIEVAQANLQAAKMELAKILQSVDDETETLRQIKQYYNQFLGWSEEFDLAPTERKRMILSQLIDRVEVGRGYAVTVKIKMDYQEFLQMEKRNTHICTSTAQTKHCNAYMPANHVA